jgi:hypothetical protein
LPGIDFDLAGSVHVQSVDGRAACV